MTLSDQTTAIRNAMIAFRNGGSYGCERGTGEPLPLYRDIPKGEIFPAGKKGDDIVSFDLLDNVISLTHGGLGKYLYHQQEALWN